MNFFWDVKRVYKLGVRCRTGLYTGSLRGVWSIHQTFEGVGLVYELDVDQLTSWGCRGDELIPTGYLGNKTGL